MHQQKEPTDQVDEMLKRTGCAELHYKVQECIAEKRDWRQCQGEVSEFRKCMEKHRPPPQSDPRS